jgi:hypothetical protein
MRMDENKLTATLNSVGATELSGSAVSADIINKSVGKLEAAQLKTDTLSIKNNAVGAVEIYADKELSIDHSGVGKLTYHGNATIKNLHDNGMGKVTRSNS